MEIRTYHAISNFEWSMILDEKRCSSLAYESVGGRGREGFGRLSPISRDVEYLHTDIINREYRGYMRSSPLAQVGHAGVKGCSVNFGRIPHRVWR
jgi:hypothetical protein